MKPNEKPAGSGDDVLKVAASSAGRFFRRLREEYKAGLAGAPDAAQTPRPPLARQPNARPWWEVLGVRETASLEEITAAYRELLHKSHPDKVAQLSDRLRQVAAEETQQLNAAYEEARRVKARR
jgi:DnaJ-domain-containing protein 1